jgi:hypothetical protein
MKPPLAMSVIERVRAIVSDATVKALGKMNGVMFLASQGEAFQTAARQLFRHSNLFIWATLKISGRIS